MSLNGYKINIIVLTIAIAFSGVLYGDIQMPSVIGSNMVLQQGMQIPIWGKADPCEQVVVKFSGGTWKTTADTAGKWEVKIGPFNVQKEGQDLTIDGNNTLVLKNVLVGEVWLCSGQSNMEFKLSGSANSRQEISEADYAQIRLFTVGNKVSYTPMGDCRGSWKVCEPNTAKNFSAVGYFFGRQIHKQTGVPVGLINASWGGTPAEAWTSREYLENDPNLQPILKRFDETVANYTAIKQKYNEQKAQYDKMAAKMRAEHKTPPWAPEEPIGKNHPYSPTGLFNGMIKPIIPYAIRGAIWYQGESNAGRAYQYRTLFPTMIKCWREAWKQGDFPFLYVQLANWKAIRPEPTQSDWAELREAQLLTLSTPNTGMAVAIDIGDMNGVGDMKSLHPENKQDVGKRLALWALARIYKKDIEYSGPLYKSMDISGDKVILHFDHVAGGLMVSSSLGAEVNEPLKGFAIAGADRKFVWAEAKIEGDTVVVWSDKVAETVAVRYGWADNPLCNLYNKAGLPASPFRTDAWPGLTNSNR
jgi:sialate O-acetylesterase